MARKKNNPNGLTFSIIFILIVLSVLIVRQLSIIDAVQLNDLSLHKGETYSFDETTITINKMYHNPHSTHPDQWLISYIDYTINEIQYTHSYEDGRYPIIEEFPESNIRVSISSDAPNGGLLIGSLNYPYTDPRYKCTRLYASDELDRLRAIGGWSSADTPIDVWFLVPYSASEGCYGEDAHMSISTTLLKTDYNISTSAPDTLFTNQNYKMPITIESFGNFDGFIEVEFDINNPFFQTVEKVYNFTFEEGVHDYEIEIPTAVESKLTITARAGVYLPSDEFHAEYFTPEFEHFFLINPREIYIPVQQDPSECTSLDGYILSYDEQYCIRDDLWSLPCQQTGCPTITDSNITYECSSSGYCTQFVSKFIDRFTKINESQCNELCAPLDGICQLSNNEDWYCIKKEIAEVIIELPTPVYINKNCSDFDLCADGYTCKDVIIEGQSQATCEKETIVEKIITDYSLVYAVLIFSAFVIIAIILYKKRQK